MGKHRSHDDPDPGIGPDSGPPLGRRTPGTGGTELPHRAGSHPAGAPAADADPGLARQIDFEAVQRDGRFRELRRTHRSFVFPMAAAFLIWYFLYVLLADYANEFMSTKVIGNINVGLILGLLQFVSTFAITMAYVAHANRRFDPLAAELRDELEGGDSAFHRRPEGAGDTFDGDVDVLAGRDAAISTGRDAATSTEGDEK